MPAEEKKDIDPLQRVFVPIEKKTADGTIVFRTLDNQVYHRLRDGSIRRETPKINGKLARKLRAHVHRKA
jgi:hypothetical protein